MGHDQVSEQTLAFEYVLCISTIIETNPAALPDICIRKELEQ